VAGRAPVVHPELGNRKGIGVSAFLLALVTAGAMAHVGVRMKGIEVAYDLGRERRINTQLEEERRRLNIEIGMLKDPVRVVSIARDKLNMGPPAQTDIVRIEPGQVLGATPAPATAAPDKPKRPAHAEGARKGTATPTVARASAPRAAAKTGAPAPGRLDDAADDDQGARGPEGDE
jgi:cell division protein FtsL